MRWILSVGAVGLISFASVAEAAPLQVTELQNRLVTADTAGSHTTTPGTTVFGLNHDGVGDLIMLTTPTSGFRGTSTLLPTGLHVLTAAHVVTQANSATPLAYLPGSSVTFHTASGTVVRNIASVTIHPSYNGDTSEGHDLAIVTLSSAAPVTVPRYDVYSGSGEVGAQGIKIGYGSSGHGNTGTTISSGTKRYGLNEYDADARNVLSALGGGTNPFDGGALPAAGLSLAFDFDNGTATNNAMDGYAPIDFNSDLGFGNDEVNSSPGDSGGPTFINDGGVFKIMGVTSYGFGFGGNPDISPGTNSSFGEISVDMRVAGDMAFLSPFVPEPSGLAFVAAALFAVGSRRRRAA